MILSNADLRRLISENVIIRRDGSVPAVDIVSIGLHLGDKFLRYKKCTESIVLPSALETELVTPNSDGEILFPPGCCLLAATEEIVQMPLDLMGFIQTKGTIARGFVTVHLCDGQIDPGYKGNITLELVNLSDFNYVLRPGTPIAQLFFHRLTAPVKLGYQGRYQAAMEPTSMRV